MENGVLNAYSKTSGLYVGRKLGIHSINMLCAIAKSDGFLYTVCSMPQLWGPFSLTRHPQNSVNLEFESECVS